MSEKMQICVIHAICERFLSFVTAVIHQMMNKGQFMSSDALVPAKYTKSWLLSASFTTYYNPLRTSLQNWKLLIGFNANFVGVFVKLSDLHNCFGESKTTQTNVPQFIYSPLSVT